MHVPKVCHRKPGHVYKEEAFCYLSCSQLQLALLEPFENQIE